MFKKLRGNLILIGLLGLVWLWIRRPRSEQSGSKINTIEIPVETAKKAGIRLAKPESWIEQAKTLKKE